MEFDFDAESQKVLDSSVIIKSLSGARGRGIVVTSNKLLTALHGVFKQGTACEVIDWHGKVRNGFVLATWYSPPLTDIVVIQLSPHAPPFETFIPVSSSMPVRLGSEIWLVGRVPVRSGTDEYTNSVEKSVITSTMGTEGSAMSTFRSTYFSESGMSAYGGVVVVRSGGAFQVVGVHVARRNSTTTMAAEEEADNDHPPPSKKRKTKTTKKKGKKPRTVSSNNSNCLVCEVARVEGLLELLS